jgi:vacuolar protein sorting-associated protein 13A/C
MEKSQDTIINNIQIYIKNIHIRYEDKHSIPNKIISFGLYFKEFKAETVDANGKPNFLNAEEKTIFKKGSLLGFNIYWNVGEDRSSLISLQNLDAKQKQDSWAVSNEFWIVFCYYFILII